MARTHAAATFFAAVVVTALLALTLGSSQASASQSDTLAFLQSFPPQFSALRSSWTGTNYCSGWLGVTCDDATAMTGVRVKLSSSGLTGYMPDPSESLTSIDVVEIDLSNNGGITGNFKSSWASLKSLQTLDLSYTGLYGSIPDAWNGMTALQSVKIANAKACYALPNWSTGMVSLTTIDLSNNQMYGRLVSSWANIPNLASVNIQGNPFCGCMPSEWNNKPVLVAAANAVSSSLTSTDCRGNNCQNAGYCKTDASASKLAAYGSVMMAAFVAVFVAML